MNVLIQATHCSWISVTFFRSVFAAALIKDLSVRSVIMDSYHITNTPCAIHLRKVTNVTKQQKSE